MIEVRPGWDGTDLMLSKEFGGPTNLDRILFSLPVLPEVRLLPPLLLLLFFGAAAEQTVRRRAGAAAAPVCIRAANKAVDQTGLNGRRRRSKERGRGEGKGTEG